MDEGAEIMQTSTNERRRKRWRATGRFDNIVGQLEGTSLLSDAISDRGADFAVTCV